MVSDTPTQRRDAFIAEFAAFCRERQVELEYEDPDDPETLAFIGLADESGFGWYATMDTVYDELRKTNRSALPDKNKE